MEDDDSAYLIGNMMVGLENRVNPGNNDQDASSTPPEAGEVLQATTQAAPCTDDRQTPKGSSVPTSDYLSKNSKENGTSSELADDSVLLSELEGQATIPEGGSIKPFDLTNIVPPIDATLLMPLGPHPEPGGELEPGPSSRPFENAPNLNETLECSQSTISPEYAEENESSSSLLRLNVPLVEQNAQRCLTFPYSTTNFNAIHPLASFIYSNQSSNSLDGRNTSFLRSALEESLPEDLKNVQTLDLLAQTFSNDNPAIKWDDFDVEQEDLEANLGNFCESPQAESALVSSQEKWLNSLSQNMTDKDFSSQTTRNDHEDYESKARNSKRLAEKQKSKIDPSLPANMRQSFHLSLMASELSGDSEKVLYCPHCNFSSSDKTTFRKHLFIHGNDRNFKCPYCSYMSKYYAGLKAHFKVHTAEKPFKCPSCDYKSKRKQNLVQHLKTHNKDKSFACVKCPYKCSSKRSLQRHSEKHLSCDENEREYAIPEDANECFMCKIKFPSEKELSAHLEDLHSNENVVSSTQEVDPAVNIASPKNSFRCPHCDFTSLRKCALGSHIKSHTRARNASTRHDYRLKALANLTQHLKHGENKSKGPLGFQKTYSMSSGFPKPVAIPQQEETLTISVGDEKAPHFELPTKAIDCYVCPYCSFTCNMSEILKVHICNHEGDLLKSFKKESQNKLNQSIPPGSLSQEAKGDGNILNPGHTDTFDTSEPSTSKKFTQTLCPTEPPYTGEISKKLNYLNSLNQIYKNYIFEDTKYDIKLSPNRAGSLQEFSSIYSEENEIKSSEEFLDLNNYGEQRRLKPNEELEIAEQNGTLAVGRLVPTISEKVDAPNMTEVEEVQILATFDCTQVGQEKQSKRKLMDYLPIEGNFGVKKRMQNDSGCSKWSEYRDASQDEPISFEWNNEEVSKQIPPIPHVPETLQKRLKRKTKFNSSFVKDILISIKKLRSLNLDIKCKNQNLDSKSLNKKDLQHMGKEEHAKSNPFKVTNRMNPSERDPPQVEYLFEVNSDVVPTSSPKKSQNPPPPPAPFDPKLQIETLPKLDNHPPLQEDSNKQGVSSNSQIKEEDNPESSSNTSTSPDNCTDKPVTSDQTNSPKAQLLLPDDGETKQSPNCESVEKIDAAVGTEDFTLFESEKLKVSTSFANEQMQKHLPAFTSVFNLLSKGKDCQLPSQSLYENASDSIPPHFHLSGDKGDNDSQDDQSVLELSSDPEEEDPLKLIEEPPKDLANDDTNSAATSSKKAVKQETEDYECNLCQQSFTNKRSLSRHKMIHKGTYLKCFNCKFVCKSKKELIQHCKKHEEAYSCSRCNFTTYLKSSILSHFRMHNQKYLCSFCDFECHYIKDLDTHCHKVHGEEMSMRCSYCNFEASRTRALRIHMKREHYSEVPYVCKECNVRFKTARGLEKHLASRFHSITDYSVFSSRT